MIEERVVGSITPTEQALNWRWHFPIDTPIGDRRKLVAEERHVAITDRWPEVPRPGLGGKTPREAAGDPQLRIPLMAAVLILEQGSNNRGDATSIAVLRDKLGLPQPEPIDASGRSVAALPLVRVPRLIMETVTDDDLVQLYRRSILIAARTATTHLAQEAVRRPSVAASIPPADAYRRLIAAEDDDDRALALIAGSPRATPKRPANRPPPGTSPNWNCTSRTATPSRRRRCSLESSRSISTIRKWRRPCIGCSTRRA